MCLASVHKRSKLLLSYVKAATNELKVTQTTTIQIIALSHNDSKVNEVMKISLDRIYILNYANHERRDIQKTRLHLFNTVFIEL